MPNPEERLYQPRNVDPPVQYVSVVNVDIKFWTMVWLIIKWTIAAIPAAIFLSLIAAMIIGVLSYIGQL